MITDVNATLSRYGQGADARAADVTAALGIDPTPKEWRVWCLSRNDSSLSDRVTAEEHAAWSTEHP